MGDEAILRTRMVNNQLRTFDVTDHRIQLTLHKLDAIVEGDMEELIGALRSHHQAALLEEQSRDTF